MPNFNLNEMKKNALLQMAAGQLGKDPAELRQKLESGQTDELVSGLNDEQRAKLNNVLKNPESLKAILGSAQVQNLIKSLGNQKGG